MCLLFSNLFVDKYLYVTGSCPVRMVDIKHAKQGAKGICVDKKQIMNQWKTYNKSIEYSFVSWERNKENKENMEKRRKIKRCNNPGSYPLCDLASDPLCDLVPADQACDFKEGIKDLKQEMTKMKRELIIAIHAQKNKNCRQQRYGNVGQRHKKKNYFSKKIVKDTY